jgi:hypothetical protein
MSPYLFQEPAHPTNHPSHATSIPDLLVRTVLLAVILGVGLNSQAGSADSRRDGYRNLEETGERLVDQEALENGAAANGSTTFQEKSAWAQILNHSS